MKFTSKGAQSRRIDRALSITDVFDGEGFAFDFVIASLNGEHPLVVNRVSDRAYYLLHGAGTVVVGEEVHDVGVGDLITIKANTPHSLKGNMRYIIITSPPFDPNNESLVGQS